MLGGYSEDRVFRYEDGGVAKSHREITMENGQIVSKGSIGIPEDSLIHTKKVNSPVPPQEAIAPYKNGVRSTGEMFEMFKEEENFEKNSACVLVPNNLSTYISIIVHYVSGLPYRT